MPSSNEPPESSLTPPTDTIERILYLAPKVHIYAIPPLASNKGYQASLWTQPPAKEIFTARLRVLETSSPTSSVPETSPVAVSILLEDPSSGDLFAAAPYNAVSVVEAAVDSSRFFAVRVQGEGGRKAVLGLGFEERSEALDFNIALQEARKVLGLMSQPSTPMTPKSAGHGKAMSGKDPMEGVKAGAEAKKKDWSLKEGEMLHLDIGGRKGAVGGERGGKGIEPPSGGGQLSATGTGFGLLPPPPSAREVREEKRRSREIDVGGKTLEQMGFDDGEFGEFQ